MNQMKRSSARSNLAFGLAIVFIVASWLVWAQTDISDSEAVTGIWLGAACWVWGVVWVAIGVSSGIDRLVARATTAVGASLALMVAVDYMSWEQASFYLLDALAVVGFLFGIFYRKGREAGPPDFANRSAVAFVMGVILAIAAMIIWSLSDIPQDEVLWGVWLGLGCLAWTIVWIAFTRSYEIDQILAQALKLVAVVMAVMAAVDYMSWERAGLYLLEALAVVSVTAGLAHWLEQSTDDNLEPESESESDSEAVQA